MKLLFIHTHPFYFDGKDYYSGGTMHAKVWNNYLIYFDRVTVIGRETDDLINKNALSSGDPRVQFALVPNHNSLSNIIRNYNTIRTVIEKQIIDHDVILLRLPCEFGYMAYPLIKKHKKAFIVEQVGNTKEALSSHSLKGKICAPFFDYLNKRVVKNSRHVIYVTPKKLQKDYPTNGYAIDISNVVLPYRLKEDQISKERFKSNPFKLGLIGTFTAKYKGQDILLKAIDALPEEIRRNIELYFAGEGNYDWVLDIADRYKLKDNLKFIGAIPTQEEIFNFLKPLSLYLQPSLTEGMPRAMIESMAMGCPVLASNAGGIPDILSPNYIHNAGNSSQLTQQLLELYNDRTKLYGMAIENLYKSEAYLKENLVKKRLQIFQDLSTFYKLKD